MTPTIYTYDSLWGHCNSQEVGIVQSGAGRYLCGWIVIIVTNKNLLSQMKCVEARGRETPGFFCLIMSFQQRGFSLGASAGVHQQGHFSWVASAGALRQGASAGALRQGHIDRGTSTGGFGRVTSAGGIRQGYIDRRIWQGATVGVHQQGCFGRVLQQGYINGGFGRGTSTFSKYYEFPVTINGNIRLYCGTTRKRRQEKEKEDKKKKTRERLQEKAIER